MALRIRWLISASLLGAACRPAPLPIQATTPDAPIADATTGDVTDAGEKRTDATDATDAASVIQAGRDTSDDGNDDGEEIAGPLSVEYKLVKVGTPPLALTRICDLTAFHGALYAAHANAPLGSDGATVTKYIPAQDGGSPFRVAFDWNRAGEPTKGGGAGQGFLRVRAIGDRLFVPDADPPYAGFGLRDHGTEGYVYVSTADGAFAKAIPPHANPPSRPKDGGAGAVVLPRAYHVIDVAKFGGEIVVATGAVPPNEPAWRGPSPGALFAGDLDRGFHYAVDFPFPYDDNVTRLTFLARFRGALYAGIQDYAGRSPYDYVRFTSLDHEGMHPVRVTPRGAAGTLRWYADRAFPGGRLFWIAWGKDGVLLRVTKDGETWEEVALPVDAGAPTDVVRFGDRIVVLCERALLALDDALAPTLLTRIADKKSPFELTDFFCAAPLAVMGGILYAGGQRGGTLYRFEATTP